MEKFSGDLSNFDMQKAMALAKTDAARQLFASLQASHSPQMEAAIQDAAAGDMTKAKQLLQELMANDSTRTLLQHLMGQNNG